MQPNNIIYGLDDKPSLSITMTAAVQWLAFMMMNTIVPPVIIGNAYGLDGAEVVSLVQRTILLVGAASLLQIYWGHRLPLLEGVAGLWWSIFVIMGQHAATVGGNARALLPKLEGALIVAGLLLVIIGFTPVFHTLEKMFTPLVTGIYLMLFSLQMSAILLEGMFGLEGGQIDFNLLMVSLVTLGITILASVKGKGVIKSFSALAGIVCGWSLYGLLGLQGNEMKLPEAQGIFSLPRPFEWGMAEFDIGIILTAIIACFILLSNLFASVQLLDNNREQEKSSMTGRRGSIINGVADILAGVFSGIGTVPFSVSVSFIHITGNAARIPFAIASLLMLAAGVLNPVGRFFAAIPLAVGYAISFAVFSQVLSFGINSIQKIGMSERNMLIVSLSVCTGIGIAFLPPQAFQLIPPLFRGIISNGMLVGTIIALVLEQLVFRKKHRH